MINRRTLLTYLAASPWLNVLSLNQGTASFTTATELNNEYFIAWDKLTERSPIPIGFQPHGVISLSPGKLLVIGKRPSDLMAVVNLTEQSIERVIRLPYGRHFEGHAVTDTEAGIVYTSEYDFADEISVIGRWSLATLETMDVFPAYGISAHDMLLDTDRLYCANGGFKTSPEFNRMIFSDEISSTLAIIDKSDNTLIKDVSPTEDHMSFRHLCHTPEFVFAGLQNKVKRGTDEQTIIAALSKSSMELQPVVTQNDGKPGYITSIANFQDEWIIATSHLNDLIYLVDLQANHQTHLLPAPAPQGIQLQAGRVFITVNNGLIELTDLKRPKTRFYARSGNWQNHCLV